MLKSTRHRRKPDFLMLLAIFVCLGIVLTSTVNAAEAENNKGWGVQLSAENACMQASATWQNCSNWRQQGIHDFQQDGLLSTQRAAAVRLSSEHMPDTGLVAYYALSGSHRSGDGNADLRFNTEKGFLRDYDGRQFGMALKQRYGSFGLSVGIEADRVNNLTDDPLIYLGVSNRW
jgi:hypothetical protein